MTCLRRYLLPVLLLGLLSIFYACRHRPPPPEPDKQVDLVAVRPAESSELSKLRKIRLCTYNIQNLTDGEGDGFRRTKSVVARQVRNAAGIIESLNPDIIMIQEIENEEILTRLNEQMKSPYPFTYITEFNTSRRRRVKLNIAMLSRFHPVEVTIIDFSTSTIEPKPPRGTLRTLFRLGDKHHLLIYGVHLKSNWGERERNYTRRMNATQIIYDDSRALRKSRPNDTWEIVMLGDVNTDPGLESFKDDPTLEPLIEWRDAWKALSLKPSVTIPARYGDPDLEFPSATFDRFIISKALSVSPWRAHAIRVETRGVDTQNVFTAPGQNDLHVSDHYPVTLDLVY